jgi:DNA polymerase-3 subunit gamma/tau
MAYLALYRKYRPQTFDDIMGQQHVTRTLQNALRQNRVAHAYLFCGPRGTAKTTTARVLAKALNCERGPTPEPCDHCDACVRIREGRSLDVVEIDAASNRGIDDIKLLREQIGRASAQERYKLYIIDEVHQLSADAFQALLKTLEEPPPNVVFVLATTETHRVPKTIISRCQKFDFRRGTVKDLTDRLQYVADREGMATEPEALGTIARAAAGGWRDALSLLEQVAAYSPEKIDLRAVETVLGSVEESALFRLTDALASGDTSALFTEVNRLMDDGKEPRQMLSAMSGHLRDLLWVQSGAESAVQIAPESLPRYREQASRVPASLLMSGLDAINRAESQVRWISDHRLLLELTLLKIANGLAAPETVSVTVPAPVSKAKPAASPTAQTVPPPPVSSNGSSSKESEPPAPTPDPPSALQPERPAPRKTAATPVETADISDEDFAVMEDSIEGGFEEIWQKVLTKVRPNVRGLLKDGKPLGISGKTSRVGFKHEAHVNILNAKDKKEQIDKALKEISHSDLRVKGELLKANDAPVSRSPSVREASTDNDYLSDAEFSEFFDAKKISEGDD